MDTNSLKNSLGVINEMMRDAESNNSSNVENKKSNLEELQNSTLEEKKIKSGYRLRESTLAKLNEMKVFLYPPRTSYEDIVDEAICKLYESKKQG